MIDLRAHILPGFADGPEDLVMALAMARRAVDDGILVAICTPPDYPGLSSPSPDKIYRAVAEFGGRLVEARIPLHVVAGSEIHIRPGLTESIAAGKATSLNGSRYLLIDLPPMVPPPRLEEQLLALLGQGFVPVLASPERLKWIEDGFSFVADIVRAGVWVQVTAGSLTGAFGNRTRYWAERLLASSLVHVMASDAHDLDKRPPRLSAAFDVVRSIVGEAEATNLVLSRPLIILDDEPPQSAPRVNVTVAESWNPVADLRGLLQRAV